METRLIKKLLDSRSVVAGDQYAITTKNVPGDQRLASFGIEAAVTVNNTAAGAVTVFPRQIARIFAQMFFASEMFRLHMTGRQIFADYRALVGKSLSNLGVSIAGGGATASMILKLLILLYDRNAEEPAACCQPTRLIRDSEAGLEVSFASSLQVGAGGGGTQNVTAGMVRYYANLLEGAGPKVPANLVIGYEQWQQQTVRLPGGGAYPLLYLWDEADDAITLGGGDYERLTLEVGGKPVLSDIRTEELVNDWNDEAAMGSAVDNETEQLPTSGSLLFLPIHRAKQGYKLSQLLLDPEEGQELGITWTGAATAGRFGFRRIVDSKTEHKESVAQKLTGRPEVMLRAATLKGELSGTPQRIARLERRLPTRAL